MTTLATVAAPARPRLVTRPLLVRFVSVIGTATSFYLLLSAVPLYARSAGAGTGLASSALWNLAYDGGMGLGAAGFGVIALPGIRLRSSWSRSSWPPRSCRPPSPRAIGPPRAASPSAPLALPRR